MADLDERFRSLARVRPPDLWAEIEGREPREPRRESFSRRRWIVIAVSLAVAAAGIAVAIRAFPIGSRRGLLPASPSTERIAFAWYDGSSYQIYSANADGRDVLQVTNMPISVMDPTWSPDGTKIAFQGETVPGEGGRLDIYMANADGTGVTQLTHGPDSYQHPSWSPDGTTIAATRWSASGGDVVLLPVDGSGGTVLTTGQPGDSWNPVWSPDGTNLAYVSNRDAQGNLNDEIWVVNADGTDPTDITNSPAYDRDPTWSPDGTEISFFSGSEGLPGLYVVHADGTDVQELLPNIKGGGEPAWSPDGATIAFIEDAYHLGTGRLELFDPATGTVTQLLDLVGVATPSWRPSAVTSPTPTPLASPAPTIAVSRSDVFEIRKPPGSVSALAYGFGSVWVSSFDGSDQGWITRLDAGTGEKLAEISTGDVLPTWEIGGGDLAVGDGTLWFAGASPAPGEPSGVHAYLLRIDPTTNAVVARIDLRASDPADVTIDEQGVWVMSFGLGEQPKMEVSRIDPETDEVVASIPLDATYGHHLFAIGGWIVAETNETSSATVGGTVLHIIDPKTGHETATVPLGAYAWVAAGTSGTGLWEADRKGLAQLDPGTGDVVSDYPGIPNTGDAVAVGEGGVWFIDPEGRNVLRRFNPTTKAIDLSVRLAEGPTPIAMVTSPGTLWVLNYEGTLARIDLS